MASITQTKTGFRVFVERKGIRETKSFESRAEANAWASRREYEILTGTSPKQIAKGNTLHKAFEKFRDEECPKRRGEKWEKTRINRFMREFDDCPIENFEPSHIAEWRNARLLVVEKGTVRRDMNLLKSILDTARKEWGWIAVNPITDIKRPSDPPSRNRLITDEERDKMVEALSYEDDLPVITVSQKIAVAFLIAMETGMRAGELVKCRVSGKVASLVDRVAKGDATKNGDERNVPLSKRARELFAKVDNKLDIKLGSLDTLFREAREMAGLGGFSPQGE